MKRTRSASHTVEPEILFFAQRAGWEKWLDKNHGTSAGVWLRFARASGSKTSITYPEALEVALCYGWIDALKKSESADYWLQRFTPRKPRSLWSKINREKALALIAAGKMCPAGQREVERAKADGRWDVAYASPRTMEVPADFAQALAAAPRAQSAFEQLDRTNRYAFLFRIHTAKRAETRARRIASFVDMLKRGEKLH